MIRIIYTGFYNHWCWDVVAYSQPVYCTSDISFNAGLSNYWCRHF